MATNYTSLLGFALPTTGELSGTWGDTVNNSITQLVEDSVAGSATASVTSGDWTLTTTGSGVANQARCAILIPTGTPGVSRNIIAPSQSKAYVVINQSNGAVVVKGSATTGTTVAANTEALVAWDGADFVTVASADIGNITGTLPVTKGGTGATTLTGYVKGNGTSAFTASATVPGSDVSGNISGSAGNVTGTVAVGNGGTGATTLTANNVILGNGGSAVQFVAPGANGNVLKSNGTTWTSAAEQAQVYPGAGMAVSTGSAWGTSKTTPTGDVVGTSDTQTLTNKRVNPRVVAASGTSGNLTINGDTTDLYKAEGLTGAITFLQPSGTPVDGQKLTIRIEDNGGAQGITWTTSAGAFREVGITLPTTTVAGKVTYVGCFYNSTDSFWDAVATVTQA
jgi:hypothetical protein